MRKFLAMILSFAMVVTLFAAVGTVSVSADSFYTAGVVCDLNTSAITATGADLAEKPKIICCPSVSRQKKSTTSVPLCLERKNKEKPLHGFLKKEIRAFAYFA